MAEIRIPAAALHYVGTDGKTHVRVLKNIRLDPDHAVMEWAYPASAAEERQIMTDLTLATVRGLPEVPERAPTEPRRREETEEVTTAVVTEAVEDGRVRTFESHHPEPSP